MKVHPIIDTPLRWASVLALGIVLLVVQIAMMHEYAGVDYLPALIDGVVSIGWLMALGYLAWFVVGVVSILQTRVITWAVGLLVWLAGSFAMYDVMTRIADLPYVSFIFTLPFRILFGGLVWVAILLWYQLILIEEEASSKEQEREVLTYQADQPSILESPCELIDRITVKDGSRIHLIKTEELLYIQACGDYVMLVTASGEYVKEQTMKYFESHLPLATFVRIHRSTIVNVTCISRVELFGKETYQLSLKNGVKLRVSLSGYKTLKERLGL